MVPCPGAELDTDVLSLAVAALFLDGLGMSEDVERLVAEGRIPDVGAAVDAAGGDVAVRRTIAWKMPLSATYGAGTTMVSQYLYSIAPEALA